MIQKGRECELEAWRGAVDCSDQLCKCADMWLRLVVRGLNHQDRSVTRWCTPSKAQQMALQKLWNQCCAFVTLPECVLQPPLDVSAYYAGRGVTYSGEVTMKAEALTWSRMMEALPPEAYCASIPAVALAKGSLKHYLENPDAAIIDVSTLTERPKPGRVLMAAGEEKLIACGLIDRNICKLIPKRELLHIGGRPVVNGCFGIPKPNHTGDGASPLRFIMNLTASNSIMKRFDGDVAVLPALNFWRAIVLSDEETLVMSYEDLRGAFYLLSVPPGWCKWFAFNIRFTLNELGLPSAGRDAHEPLYLAAAVIPMGWLNAVGIVEGLHRELLLQGSTAGGEEEWGDPPRAVRPGVSVHHEVRRDKPMPPVLNHADWNYLWQAYIDDYDQAEVVKRHAVQTGLLAQVSHQQLQVRACYSHWGAPRSEHKTGERRTEAVRLG
eukprot:6464351-Amphidinium_carterae.1